jgi:magnesium transporter
MGTLPPDKSTPKAPPAAVETYQTLYFSELLKRPICIGKIDNRIGRLADLVFRLADPYPEVVGIYVDHGWGKAAELIPWDKVIKVEDDAIFVQPTENGQPYAPFVDQSGWILLNEHLMGRTVLDMDGRRAEVVNDVHLLASKGRMLLVHVDISFNGFLRKWHLRWLIWSKDQLISWRYVQPLSLENVGRTHDSVTLSVTRHQIKDLPGEDLADVLELLSHEEQQAVFSTLDSEKAAEVLLEAEPRAQRQILGNLRQERARTILTEMSVPQLAALFSVLPHDHMTEMMELLPEEDAQRIKKILSERESTAQVLMTTECLTCSKETTVADILKEIRSGKLAHENISYAYVVSTDRHLLGVVDLRDLVLASDQQTLNDVMVSPVVSVQQDDVREDMAALFAKYHYRMLPVVDVNDRLLGVIHYKDIMKGLITRAKT